MMSTGQVSYSQGVSLCMSVLSLSWGAARAFMIMRTRDEADPNPEISTVILRVWPYMIVTTIANLALLVCMGGILGGYIFCCLVLNFLSVFTTLKLTAKHFREEKGRVSLKKKKKKRVNSDEEKMGAKVENEVVQLSTQHRKVDTDLEVDKDVENLSQDPESADDDTSLIIASLCAVWIPCVVGKSSSRIFLISAITSLATKVAILAVAICLCETDLQHHLHPRPFLLLCRPENSSLLEVGENVAKCTWDGKEHLYCLSEGAEEAKNLIKMEASLTRMSTAHEIYIEELKKLRKVGKEHIELRTLSKTELSKLRDKVTKIKVDEAILDNIKNLTDEVKEELEAYGVGIVQQKIRVCDSNETVLRVSFLSVLIVAVLLAGLSTVALHKITDYKELFKR